MAIEEYKRQEALGDMKITKMPVLENAFVQVKNSNEENVKEAIFLLSNALTSFKKDGINNTIIEKELAKLEKSSLEKKITPRDVKVTFSVSDGALYG